ncbi:protein TORNADO [Trifolium repens]|nr:protein TORNADO [Trifolium repens]
MAMSNNIIGFINLLAVIISIPIIGAGIWLTNEPADTCVKFLQWPVIILDDFSGFLKRRVRSSFKWDAIRSCLTETNMCAELNQNFRMAQDFFNAHLTPMQSGCCKPPTQCAYTFVNPTYWISPINNAADMDCLQWSNDQTTLCYNCDSCKAGLLANLRKEWKRANVILIITVIVLIVVYLIGCFAFRNAKTEDLFRKYKQGYT